MEQMNCKICNNSTSLLFKANILNKFSVGYFQCVSCDFIQTEEPFWLEEAYTSAITSLDIGLLSRNLLQVPITSALINNFYNPELPFIDFGGGYGVFTRLMRDKGFDFYRFDIHCENIFAAQFDISDIHHTGKFELLTAFEVFEHLPDPHGELGNMLSYSDSVFFSTELCPFGVNAEKDWWYFMPQTGQHISFYSRKSLEHLAKINNLYFYTNNTNLHLLTRKKISSVKFKMLTRYRLAKVYSKVFGKRNSLLPADYQKILEKI